MASSNVMRSQGSESLKKPDVVEEKPAGDEFSEVDAHLKYNINPTDQELPSLRTNSKSLENESSYPPSNISEISQSVDKIPVSSFKGVLSTRDSSISALQPPLCGTGKPLSIKRRPGRPRKDGGCSIKISKPILKAKRFTSGRFLGTNCRGMRGRRKRESVLMSFRNNFGSGNPVDLCQVGNESPSRTDDTAESDSSSAASSLEKLHEDFVLFPEQWPGKVCAFCNLGERSMLGQGDMLRLKVPLGFDPPAVQKVLLASISKTEKDNLNDRSTKTSASIRRLKGIGKVKRLTSQSSLESINEPVDEIIGYPEEPDINILFDTSSGFYYVHSACALWCRDVTQTVVGGFENLELEILRASKQRCNHCGNFGAGLLCKGNLCEVTLHFPCTAASGTYQERSTYTTYCTAHMDTLELNEMLANCTVCNAAGNYFSMLMCCSCGHHYHSVCMALNPDPSMGSFLWNHEGEHWDPEFFTDCSNEYFGLKFWE